MAGASGSPGHWEPRGRGERAPAERSEQTPSLSLRPQGVPRGSQKTKARPHSQKHPGKLLLAAWVCSSPLWGSLCEPRLHPQTRCFCLRRAVEAIPLPVLGPHGFLLLADSILDHTGKGSGAYHCSQLLFPGPMGRNRSSVSHRLFQIPGTLFPTLLPSGLTLRLTHVGQPSSVPQSKACPFSP